MMKQPVSYAAPALEKGLDILELLAKEGRPMGTRQIAGELGRSKAEIFRMVFVLLERGYIIRDQVTDMLLLSNKLFGLGMQTARARDLVAIASPIIERFADEVHQAAHLVVPNRGETVVLAASSGGADMNFSLKLGYRRPLADAHSGLVMLAFQPEDVRERMITESLTIMSRSPDRATLIASLEAVRRAGSIVHESRDIVGVTDVTCPILSVDGRALACTTVVVVNRRNAEPNFNAILERQKEACAKISAQLEAYSPHAHSLSAVEAI